MMSRRVVAGFSTTNRGMRAKNLIAPSLCHKQTASAEQAVTGRVNSTATRCFSSINRDARHHGSSSWDCPAVRPLVIPTTTSCTDQLVSKSHPYTRQQHHFFSSTTTTSNNTSNSTNTTTADFTFASESDFHTVADETLEVIQDAVENLLEEELEELNYASGVLTMTLPPHGTWVLNKQTPNRQIWWSSPISGPRRYEYNGHVWVYTRAAVDTAASGKHDDNVEEDYSLGATLAHEIRHLYGAELDIKV